MNDDLVKRLRDLSYNQGHDLPDKAADRIEKLTAALQEIIDNPKRGRCWVNLIAMMALEGKKDD